MPNNGGRKMAGCPFYLSEDPHRISCEGVDDNSTLILSYPRNAAGKWRRLKRYCEGDWKACPVYRMLLKKYEKEE